MTGFIGWALIVAYAYAAIATIAKIGKPQRPTTPGIAAGSTVVTGLMIVGTYYLMVR